MCDVIKYSNIYSGISQLQPEDTLQLVLEAKSKEEQVFWVSWKYILKNIVTAQKLVYDIELHYIGLETAELEKSELSIA